MEWHNIKYYYYDLTQSLFGISLDPQTVFSKLLNMRGRGKNGLVFIVWVVVRVR